MVARTKSAFHRSSNVDVGRWVSLRSKNEAAVLYGVLISVREDYIRLKSSPSSNDETTYLVMVLIENKRQGFPVEFDGAADSVNSLARSRRHVDDRKRVEDGRMSGEWMS